MFGDIVKLNMISMLYALFLFVAVEFILNIYSISNLTGEQAAIVNTMAVITFIVVILGAALTLFFPTRKWFGKRKMKYWTAILWVPYFAIFVFVLTNAFPAIAGDFPENAVIGWAVLGAMVLYPFYIMLINFFTAR